MLSSRLHGWIALVAVFLGPCLASAAGPALPAHLPRYRLAADIDVANHVVHGRLEATWTNPHTTPTDRLVFNAHARHVVQPEGAATVNPCSRRSSLANCGMAAEIPAPALVAMRM